MGLRERFNDLSDRLNLRKRFPDYFSPWPFRVMAVLLVLVWCFLGWQYGFTERFAYCCPEDSFGRCGNPAYACSQGITYSNYLMYDCSGDFELLCEAHPELCSFEYVTPGVCVGEPEPVIFGLFRDLVWLLPLGAFLVNHVLYVWRKKSETMENN